jgi:50S ribosomal protein L16 3-hydroxylase
VSKAVDITAIQWPDELTTQRFLDEYWQKKPLLIRQALPNFETPVSPDELAGMSLEDGTTPRIITQDKSGTYHLEHGPFATDRYESIGDKHWSLLVTDCEKHWPELGDYIKPFQFLPRWRIDDLMISFAPDKASVGAHIDEYDVFLLQASGVRQWQIDASDNPNVELKDDETLRLLANFNATDTWELQPGDVLYLPPGIPHHGVAVGDNCTTWSIGFRAPSNLDVLDVFSEILLDNLPLVRMKDVPLQQDNGAEIKPAVLAQLRKMWETATHLSDEELIKLSGHLLTRGGIGLEEELEQTVPWQGQTVQWHSFAQVAYIAGEQQAELFVNGDGFTCSLAFAKTLADSQGFIALPAELNPTDEHTLQCLLQTQVLFVA